MNASTPKVLQPVLDRPMIWYVLNALRELGFGESAPKPLLVVGHGAEQVRAAVGSHATFADQTEQRGTGHAAAVGVAALPQSINTVLVLHGDEPLVEAETLAAMLQTAQKTGAPIVLLTGSVPDSHGLGVVRRSAAGRVVDLLQRSEMPEPGEGAVEINFGAYVFDRRVLEEALPLLPVNPDGEYYLTHVVRWAAQRGVEIETVPMPEPGDRMGINDPDQLRRAEAFLRRDTVVHSGNSG